VLCPFSLLNIGNLARPQSVTLDGYTQQQIYSLTHSNLKYTIVDPNAKVLTPPEGVKAYHEITFGGINNNVAGQVPLKGTGILFVNGDKGCSLLYLARQTGYSQNLAMIQQMINSFRIDGFLEVQLLLLHLLLYSPALPRPNTTATQGHHPGLELD
jgi:hypothetical protein